MFSKLFESLVFYCTSYTVYVAVQRTYGVDLLRQEPIIFLTGLLAWDKIKPVLTVVETLAIC